MFYSFAYYVLLLYFNLLILHFRMASLNARVITTALLSKVVTCLLIRPQMVVAKNVKVRQLFFHLYQKSFLLFSKPKLTKSSLNFQFLPLVLCVPGCIYKGVYHESHTEWSEPSRPCTVMRCEAGVITESDLKCYTPCSNPLPPAPGKCCPTCPGNNGIKKCVHVLFPFI